MQTIILVNGESIARSYWHWSFRSLSITSSTDICYFF